MQHRLQDNMTCQLAYKYATLLTKLSTSELQY